MDELKSGLFGKVINIMGKSLNLRLAKHNLTATNLANMDVPGYRMRDLPFEKTLQKALGAQEGRLEVRQTHAEHLPIREVERAYNAAKSNVVYGMYGQDEKGHDLIDIDQEMNKLAKNQLMYYATVQTLAKKFESLNYVIDEGGR